MTETEYKAWCWRNQDMLTEKWMDFSKDTGVEGVSFCQAQPIVTENSLELTNFVAFEASGSKAKGVYFSVYIENKNVLDIISVSTAIMQISNSEGKIYNFMLRLYPNGCSSNRIEYSMIEIAAAQDLFNLFSILKFDGEFKVAILFHQNDMKKIWRVDTTINGNLNVVDNALFSLEKMIERSLERAYAHFSSIMQNAPEFSSYFQDISKTNFVKKIGDFIGMQWH